VFYIDTIIKNIKTDINNYKIECNFDKGCFDYKLYDLKNNLLGKGCGMIIDDSYIETIKFIVKKYESTENIQLELLKNWDGDMRTHKYNL
jgi:hypothetical protein